MLRFYLDEHVSHAVAHGLKRRQIDVTTATDAGLLHATDEEHLSFALRECRVIVTNDSDFLRIAATGIPHAGIVYCPPGKSHIGEMIRYLALMDACLSADDVDSFEIGNPSKPPILVLRFSDPLQLQEHINRMTQLPRLRISATARSTTG